MTVCRLAPLALLGVSVAWGEIPVACSISQSVVTSGARVPVAAFADSQDPHLRYDWVAPIGKVEPGAGGKASWNLAGVSEGTYTLSVAVTDTKGSTGHCFLSLIVESDETRGAAPESAISADFDPWRSFLVKGKNEAKGYGLYSYILLGPTKGASRARYRKLVEAYLNQIVDVKKLDEHLRPAQLNMTYLPVDEDFPDSLTDDGAPDWILNHYDYGRGEVIERNVLKAGKEGPFIISCPKPPTQPEGGCLVQDLSGKPPSVIEFWMNEFKSQTSQQRSWSKATLDRVALNLRTAIAVGAQGLPDVRASVLAWISVK